jgi:hypothetical protein
VFSVDASKRFVEISLCVLQGKEAEMFVSLAKRYNKPNALNEVFESRLKNIDKNDYLALTTLYLQVFNPTRANGAEKLCTKYKGREETMFADLSSKWFTCNPLEKAKPVAPAVVAPAVVAPAVVAPAAAPNLFTQSSGKLSRNAPAPSPFSTEGLVSVVPEPVATGAIKNDYHELLTEFYQKHNPQKVSEVTKTLENYKVRIKFSSLPLKVDLFSETSTFIDFRSCYLSVVVLVCQMKTGERT